MQHEAQRLCDAGTALAERGLYTEAFTFYEKALAVAAATTGAAPVAPASCSVVFGIHFNYGLALFRTGRFDDAVAELNKAYELCPSNDDCADTLALSLQKAGNTERAESLFLTVTQRNPQFGRSWNNLGVLYFEHGEYLRARTCFETALSCNERDCDALFNLRDTCLELGDKKAATRYTARMRTLGVSE